MRKSQSPVILFLQGPPSAFWPELARGFEARGAKTLRVNFSAGDWLYWRKGGAINYRGTLGDWPDFLETLIEQNGVTDILYYTDRLPYHVEAARVAAQFGVNCYSIEFGYLRPDWLTLERGGMGSYSHFPVDPDVIRAVASQVPKPDLSVRYTHTFGQEAVNEVAYNLATYFGKPFYHRYDADKYYDPFIEYLLWLPRFVMAGRAKRHAEAVSSQTSNQPFWLLGMQLQSDYQVRANSHYPHLADMLGDVIGSFAAHAPAGHRLLIKQHPLDNGWETWDKVALRIARTFGVEDRIWFIDGGDLTSLIARSEGVVIVNSTVGLHSIQAGRPTKVLGMAIYDIPGLTHQGSLDSFWISPEPVDETLVQALVAALAATIQVKGNFYNKAGRALAATEIVERVLNGRVNEPGAFVTPPPRLAKALMRRGEQASGMADATTRSAPAAGITAHSVADGGPSKAPRSLGGASGKPATAPAVSSEVAQRMPALRVSPAVESGNPPVTSGQVIPGSPAKRRELLSRTV